MASDAREKSTTPAYASRENLRSEALSSSVPAVDPNNEALIFSKLAALFQVGSPKAYDNYAETNQRVGWGILRAVLPVRLCHTDYNPEQSGTSFSSALRSSLIVFE
jgi:hypothetical protein